MIKSQGIIDGIVQELALEVIIGLLIKFVPWLGAGWFAPILSYLVSYIIKPIFIEFQKQFNVVLINWEVYEQDEKYKEQVEKMREVVRKIEAGELDVHSEEVQNAREAYKSRLRDLIVFGQ